MALGTTAASAGVSVKLTIQRSVALHVNFILHGGA